MERGSYCGVVERVRDFGWGRTAGGPVGSKVSPAKALDSQLSVIESEMMGAVKAMPAEKYGFAPSAAIFVPRQT